MKTNRFALVFALALIFSLIFGFEAFAQTRMNSSPTKVGNGDDGSDLEGVKRVTSGILIETRKKAVERARKIGVASVEHLGSLIPEIEKSDIYLVSRDMEPKLEEDNGSGGNLEGSPDGKAVYARTFAEPHAATRFFPAALLLDEEQLISLHIHEALHRSLPAEIREDEEKVTRITLAIAGPDASLDRVRKTVAKETEATETVTNAGGTTVRTRPGGGVTVIVNNGLTQSPMTSETRLRTQIDRANLDRPSSVTYGYRSFFLPEKERSEYPIESMHSLQSFVYPFGQGPHAIGMGIEMSYLKTPEQAIMGPLALSARMRLMSIRKFEVGAFASLALNTLADGELKSSRMGRDVTTLGLTLLRDDRRFYVENQLAISGEGDAQQKHGPFTYNYHYGTNVAASIRAGGKYKGFELGGFAELLLSDGLRVSGPDFTSRDGDSGRYRIIGAGPELAYAKEAFRLSLSARWIIDSTPEVNLDYLGDLLGRGAGQGFVSGAASLRF
jgi:hypothetical protein